ncbi:Nn.00g115660.m01.CDS01 [Neocucurbitaria sp. VM-36]
MVDNRGPELQAVCSTFVSFAFVATALRVYVRTFIVKAFGYDDAFMVFALLAHIMFAGCAIGGIHWGTGRHMDTLDADSIMKAMRYWWLCYIAYCWAMIGAKISIGLFLLRVTIHKIHRWIIYVAMGLTVLTGLIFFFVTLLQCSPISYFWDRTQENGWCVPIDVIIGLTFLYSGVSVICDFTFAILPMFLVWGLNMSVRTRLVLIPILGMACVASVAVVVRLAYVMDFKNPDFLWATVDIAIWSDIEQGLAITAGSLATLRPLYRQVASKFGFTSTNTPSGPSKPSVMRTPQWHGAPTNDSRKKFGFLSLSNTLLRTEKGTTRDKEEEYGMGDLQPMRLRDDLVAETSSEKSDKGYNTWQIQAGKVSDEECRPGTITMQSEIFQQSDRRSAGKF